MTRALFRMLCIAFFGYAALAPPALAAEMPWGNRKVVYAAVEPKDLRAFLREFAAQQSVGVFIDPEVKGELTGRYELTPRSMMELLGRTFGLIWYYDGKVLYVYPSSAVESTVIRLSESTPTQFQRTLDRLGISDSRFPVSFDGNRGTALVSGPRRLVELARQAATASDRPNDIGDPTTGLRVFKLKFAFADDYTVTNGGREYRVPGVASILRQASGSVAAGAGNAGNADGRRTGLVERRSLDSAAALSGPQLPLLRGRGNNAAGDDALDDARPVVSTARGVPNFAADSRTNSVIVRDIPSRLDQYEALIRRLDERPSLVEIEANIVEINSDDLSALGIDWRLTGSRGRIEVGSGGIANQVLNPAGAVALPVSGDPLQGLNNIAGTVLSVIGGTRTQLLGRIAALEQAGKATVSAQPKVMTLNNVEAALDASRTFFVRVQGFQDSRLFEVSSGTSIRITPSVVGADAQTDGLPAARDMVRLLIKIEDGGITGQQVDQLPVVQKTTINTQSLVTEGSTLLIAGYAQERDSQQRSGVPGLSRLPVLGNLFKSTESNRSRVERLFMITPRVVDLARQEIPAQLTLAPSAAPVAAPVAAAAPAPLPGMLKTAYFSPAGPATASKVADVSAAPAEPRSKWVFKANAGSCH